MKETKQESQSPAKVALSSFREISRTLILGLIIWIVNTLYQIDKTVDTYSWRLDRLEKHLDSVDRRIENFQRSRPTQGTPL